LVAIALKGCLLTAPLDDVRAGEGGDGGTGPAPVVAAMTNGGRSSMGGTSGGLLGAAGGAGMGGSVGIPLDEWCPDPVDTWALDNPYWATYELESGDCMELAAGEFTVTRDRAEEGCEITDSLVQSDVCSYAEAQRCEDSGLELALVFVQSAPDEPIEGALLIYPLGATAEDEPTCSFRVTLTPASDL
jgi:hypothetical protein